MELDLSRDILNYYNQDIIAKTGLSTLYMSLLSGEPQGFKTLFAIKKHLLKQHPNNIVLRNSINFFLFNLSGSKINEQAKEKHAQIIKKINLANKEISKIGAKKIRPNSTIFVHSINNHIFDILMHASKYKTFSLNLVEHNPFNFGGKLSKKIKGKIKARLFPDLALKDAVTSASTCFIGGEAILKNKGAIVKTGSTMAGEISKKYNIPVYVVAHTLKYDHDMTMLKQLGHEHKHSDHSIRGVYEALGKDIIDAYISEYGIFKPEHIINEIRLFNKWMFI